MSVKEFRKLSSIRLSILPIAWAATFIIPHFQPGLNLYSAALSVIIAFLLYYGVDVYQRQFSHLSFRFSSVLTIISLSLFPVLYLLLRLGLPFPYSVWTRFGAGSMIFNSQLFPFGDLVHLTAAVPCPENPKVGQQICDLWDRPLNQNPFVIDFFRFFNLSNVEIVGMVSYLLFSATVIGFVWTRQINGVNIPIFLITPPCVLAFDRGNEIITVLLILLSIPLLTSGKFRNQVLGSLLITGAGLFKLWPIFVIGFLLVYCWRSYGLLVRMILASSIGFWVAHMEMVQRIHDATQSGSSFGVSFGLNVMINSENSRNQVIFLIFVTAIFFILYYREPKKQVQQFLSIPQVYPNHRFLMAFLSTYFLVWMVGDNFAYRLLLFTPAILLLSKNNPPVSLFNNQLARIILTTMLCSRLPIFSAVAAAAALYFAMFVAKNLSSNVGLFR